jgi:phosphonate transport system ATP-binding protein
MSARSSSGTGLSLRARDLAIGHHADAPLARDLDLDVAPGEMLAVRGPSGVGKSTLLATLDGTVPALGGAARYAAADGRALAPPAVRGRIARVAQDLLLVLPSTLEQNVLLGRLPRYRWWRTLIGFPRHDRQEARALLARLGLAHLAGRRAAAVSGGERQRTAVARALFGAPEVLLADEPTANLDPATADVVMTALREHARRTPAAVVVVVHDRALAERFADRQLLLEATA